MKNIPKNLRFEVSPEEFRALLKRVERIEKELIRGGNLYDRVVDGKPLSDAEVEHIRRLRRALQKSDIDARVTRRVETILYDWDTERKVCNAVARIVQNQIQINVTEKQTKDQ